MTRSRVLAAVLALVAAVLVTAVVRAGDRPAGPGSRGSPATPAALEGDPRQASALRVLHAWDRSRSSAYRAASTRRLRSLYVDGSTAGRADVRLLGEYRSRGLRVAGLRTQVLALDVLISRRDRLEVRVSDRMVGALAVGGGRRLPLPRDSASTRDVVLVRSADGPWRVAEVRDAR